MKNDLFNMSKAQLQQVSGFLKLNMKSIKYLTEEKRMESPKQCY